MDNMPVGARKFKRPARTISLVVSLVVLAVLGWFVLRDIGGRPAVSRSTDAPPEIEFTWTPRRALTLQEFKGLLVMKDDYALDFSTYHLRIVELERETSLPIEGLIGREYSSEVYLSWLAADPRVAVLERLTLEISIADDRGQKTEISRVVRLKPPPTKVELFAE